MTEHPTLVLIPGLLCDRVVWEPVIDRLAGRMAVAVADLSTQDDITRMARDVLARYPGPLLVAGHSMGGRVAMEMVRLAPDRILKLALLSTGIHPKKDGEEERRQEMIDFAHAHGMAALAARWLPPMIHPDRHADAALMGLLTAMVERMTPELHERQIRALVNRPDAARGLPAIACPTLLVVGREDAWSPLAQHEEMLALLPNASLTIIERAGHFAPVERPEAVADAIEHWATA